MSNCTGLHQYIESSPRQAIILPVQCTPYEQDISIKPTILWTVEKLCIICHKTTLFDQDGAIYEGTR